MPGFEPTGSVLLRKACAYARANFAAVTRNAKPANADLHRPLHANHSLAFGQKTIPRTVFYPSALRAYHFVKASVFPRLFLLCRDSNPTGSVLLRKACALRAPTSLRSLGMLSLQMPVCTGLCTLTILSPSGKKQSPGLFFIPQPCAPTKRDRGLDFLI